MKKRFLASLLSLVMLLTMLPVTAFAAGEDGTTGDGNETGGTTTPVTLTKVESKKYGVKATLNADSNETNVSLSGFISAPTADDAGASGQAEGDAQTTQVELSVTYDAEGTSTKAATDGTATVTLTYQAPQSGTTTKEGEAATGSWIVAEDNKTVTITDTQLTFTVASTIVADAPKVPAVTEALLDINKNFPKEVMGELDNNTLTLSGALPAPKSGESNTKTSTLTFKFTDEFGDEQTKDEEITFTYTAANTDSNTEASWSVAPTEFTFIEGTQVGEDTVGELKATIENEITVTETVPVLTAEAGAGEDARKITVKNGETPVTSNVYYAFLETVPTVPYEGTTFENYKGSNTWKELPAAGIPANEGGELYVVALDKASTDTSAIVVGVSTAPVDLTATYTVTIATVTDTGVTDDNLAVTQADGTALTDNAITVASDAEGKVKVTYTTGNVITSAVDETGKATVAAGTPTDNTTDGTTSCVYTISAVSADVTVTFTVAAKDEDKSGEITLNKGTGEESNISTLPPKATMENGTATVEITVAAGRTLVAPTSTDFTVKVDTPDSTNKYTVTITLKAATFPESAELTFTTEEAQGGDDGDESFVVTLTKDATSVEAANLVITAPAAVENKHSLTFDAGTTTETVTLTTAKDYVVTATVTPTGAATVSTPTSTGTDTLTWTCTISNVTADATVAFKAAAPAPAPAEKYTIKFAAGTGATGTMDNVEVAKNASGATEYTIPESTFTAPTGKEFDVWTVAPNTVTISGNKLTIPATVDTATEITLTATWKDAAPENPDNTVDSTPTTDNETQTEASTVDTAPSTETLTDAVSKKELVIDAAATNSTQPNASVEIKATAAAALVPTNATADYKVTIKTHLVDISIPKALFTSKLADAGDVKLDVKSESKKVNAISTTNDVKVFSIGFTGKKNSATANPIEIKDQKDSPLTVSFPVEETYTAANPPVIVYINGTDLVEYFEGTFNSTAKTATFALPHLSDWTIMAKEAADDLDITDGNAETPASPLSMTAVADSTNNYALVTVSGTTAGKTYLVQVKRNGVASYTLAKADSATLTIYAPKPTEKTTVGIGVWQIADATKPFKDSGNPNAEYVSGTKVLIKVENANLTLSAAE